MRSQIVFAVNVSCFFVMFCCSVAVVVLLCLFL